MDEQVAALQRVQLGAEAGKRARAGHRLERLPRLGTAGESFHEARDRLPSGPRAPAGRS